MLSIVLDSGALGLADVVVLAEVRDKSLSLLLFSDSVVSSLDCHLNRSKLTASGNRDCVNACTVCS